MKRHIDTGILVPEELDLLQACFEDIASRYRLERDSDTAGDTARALVIAFRRGVTERSELIRLAEPGPIPPF